MKWFLLILLLGAASAGLYFAQDFDLDDWLLPAEESAFVEDATEGLTRETMTLVDRDGRELVCQLVSVDGQMVTVIRSVDGQTFSFGMDRLSRKSRQELEQWQAQNGGRTISEFDEYELAKAKVRVEIVVSENIDATPDVKRFLNAHDFNYVVYDAFKSTKGRRLLEEHGLTRGPAFIIGDEVVVGLQLRRIQELIIEEYRRQNGG
ncbi:hypothetical protein [Cerasicoccus fimbriatus]|uniref:hypothetical protein n=1 Tax=Cerasicoccus fimbriatus TaxID=3014554 RepID=UPI0022B4452F|nr:hypothetical protein [Cerasicoccus sp. TK19100]